MATSTWTLVASDEGYRVYKTTSALTGIADDTAFLDTADFPEAMLWVDGTADGNETWTSRPDSTFAAGLERRMAVVGLTAAPDTKTGHVRNLAPNEEIKITGSAATSAATFWVTLFKPVSSRGPYLP